MSEKPCASSARSWRSRGRRAERYAERDGHKGCDGVRRNRIVRLALAGLLAGSLVSRALASDAPSLQVGGPVAARRLVLTGGVLAAADIFDTNRYANSTRTQFLNWSFINNTAWDFAADTRGYTRGGAAEWINPSWTIRVGAFQMPEV